MTTSAIPPLSKWRRWVPQPPVLAAWAGVLVAFLVTYAHTLNWLLRKWWTVDDYQHGFFVIPFALFLLWYRQEMVDPWPKTGTWWGIVFFVVWALMRWTLAYFNYERDIDSFFPFLVGLALVVGGVKALHWAWPSILFLVFMVPLPDVVLGALRHPLQRIATLVSVYILQTVGIPAVVLGGQSTVITLPSGSPLNVEEACSGLRMLTLFVAICLGTAFLVRRPLWEKAIIVVSSVPIAIFANVFRITLRGMLQVWVSARAGEIMHDWFGTIMMVLAMALVWGEIELLGKLMVETRAEGPLALGGGRGPAKRSPMLMGPPGGPR